MTEEQELALLVGQLDYDSQLKVGNCYICLNEVLSRYSDEISMLALARVGIERTNKL